MNRTATALCLMLWSSVASAACSTADVEVKQSDLIASSRVGYRLVGEIVSKCGEAAAVHVQTTLRGAGKKVVGVEDFWIPRSGNISPRGTAAFDRTFIPAAPAETLEWVVLEMRRKD